MQISMKLDTHGLDKADLIDWLRFNHHAQDLLTNIISGDGLYATFFDRSDNVEEDDDSDCMGYEIRIADKEKAKAFEEKWGWWVAEKWYLYNPSYYYSSEMRTWCRENLRSSQWKREGTYIKFKNLEDLHMFELIFGKEPAEAA